MSPARRRARHPGKPFLRPAADTLGEIHAAMAFGVLAASYACDPGIFPAFAEWAEAHGGIDSAFTIDKAQDLAIMLAQGMSAVEAMQGRGPR